MQTIIFIFLSLFYLKAAEIDTQALANKVIELRKEVELLNDEYKAEREKVLSELKSLSIQKAELASNIRNEEIRKKQLTEKIKKLKTELEQSSVESKELEPIVLAAMNDLQSWVESSLPFKSKERLASINELKTRIQQKEISIIKAANQLWSLIEDEKRLAKETSLHKQSLPIDGKMQLCEVAKVGMFFLYFKAENGAIGMAVKDKGQWTFQSFQNQSQKQQTLAFFESLKKQIRQGFFEIPSTI